MIVEIGFALLVSAGYIPDDSSPFLEHLNHLATKWRVVPRRRDHPGPAPSQCRPQCGPASARPDPRRWARTVTVTVPAWQ